MGKNGEKVLEETLINWDFDFEKKKSITSEDSFLLNIKNSAFDFKSNNCPSQKTCWSSG